MNLWLKILKDPLAQQEFAADLLSNVLQRLPSIKINPFSLPRMSDFAYCGEAVYQIHGKASGEFLKDFKENRNKGVQRILES